MSPTGLGPKIALAMLWSFWSMVLLAMVDAAAMPSGNNGGSVGFLLLAVLSVLAALAVLKIAGLPGARATALGSLITMAALVPCMLRAADAELVLGQVEEPAKTYSARAIFAIGACVLVVVFAVHWRLERKPPATSDPSKPDYALFGVAAVMAILSALVVASSLRLLPLEEARSTKTYAEMTVPALDSVAGDAIPIFDDGTVSVSASRTQPLPLRVARLELDLGDGVGPRPVVAVGGGERLQLLRRGDFVWELCHLTPMRGRDRASAAGDSCVTLVRFLRGAEGPAPDPRVSAIRGKVAVPPGFLVSAAIAFAAVAGTLALGEHRRRKLGRIARGQQGTFNADGTVESVGEHYTLQTPPAHNWPGPVVLLDVAEQTSPYRGSRAAGSVVPGTIAQHIAWQGQQRLALHAVVGPAFALLIASFAAAGYVGYLGF